MSKVRNEHVGDRQFVIALARGLDVLRAFRTNERALGNQEIARRTRLPKPTISRLTYTLTQLGYLNYDRQSGVYTLGAGALALGYVALANLDARRVAKPIMQSLADACGASVGLGVRDRLKMVYLDNCEGQNIVALRVTAGSRISLVRTAMGRACVAGLSERERGPLIDQVIAKYPDDKTTIVRGFDEAIRDVERHGFCLSLGEWREDVNAAAAPIAMPNGAGLYTINCGGPAYLMKGKDLEETYGPMLVSAAKTIIDAMNAPAPRTERRRPMRRDSV